MILIDLSHKISNDTPVHPYDSPLMLFHEKSLGKDHFNGYRLESGLHIGTHIDSPLHFIDGGKFISDIPIEQFCGKGVLLDVRGKQTISCREEYEDIISESDIVLLHTGLDEIYGSEDYYNSHTVLDLEFAEFLVRSKIKILGMDMFSPDRFPFGIHKFLFENGILIMENLTNLNKLLGVQGFTVFAFPLNIRAEASPLRVVAGI